MPILRLLGSAVLGLVLLVGAALAAPELETLTFETGSGPHAFQIEVAETPQQRSEGLMYRRSLADDHGMLFDFGRAEEVSMWMQNTYVSLDMVFVAADGRVTRIAENTEPLSTRIVSSGSPARYVVELAAGSAQRIGLKPGDKMVHSGVGAYAGGMKTYLIAYAAVAVAFLVGDGLWLGVVAREFYRTQLGELMSPSPNLFAAVAFYVLYVGGVVYFAVSPALAGGSWSTALISGAILGLVAYGTYDLTNLAVMRGFPPAMAMVDWAWGAALTAFAATAGFFVVRAVS